jgi:hypothetical protein
MGRQGLSSQIATVHGLFSSSFLICKSAYERACDTRRVQSMGSPYKDSTQLPLLTEPHKP